tara:strand:- start:323 stop:556 length:234 start_codon:yes stop_codon:yes gene_type:complete
MSNVKTNSKRNIFFQAIPHPHRVSQPSDCGFAFKSDKWINPLFPQKCFLLLRDAREMIHFTGQILFKLDTIGTGSAG